MSQTLQPLREDALVARQQVLGKLKIVGQHHLLCVVTIGDACRPLPLRLKGTARSPACSESTCTDFGFMALSRFKPFCLPFPSTLGRLHIGVSPPEQVTWQADADSRSRAALPRKRPEGGNRLSGVLLARPSRLCPGLCPLLVAGRAGTAKRPPPSRAGARSQGAPTAVVGPAALCPAAGFEPAILRSQLLPPNH